MGEINAFESTFLAEFQNVSKRAQNFKKIKFEFNTYKAESGEKRDERVLRIAVGVGAAIW